MKTLRTHAAGLPVYLALVFLLTYGYEIFLLPALIARAPAAATAFAALAMLLPTAAMLLARLLTGEGFGKLFLAPHLKGHAKEYLAAWFLPFAAIVLGGGVYFLVFPAQADFTLASLEAQLASLGAGAMPGGAFLAAQAVSALVISPVVNLPLCLGEEWGWRGYMMPRLLEKFSFGPACLIGGVIWGLWHAPLTVMGHNYGMGYWGYPVTGILTMCVFCVLVGVFFTWLTLKTGSCLPAALAHGALNGQAALPSLLVAQGAAPNALLGPAPSGLLGCAGLLVLAAVCLWRAKKRPA